MIMNDEQFVAEIEAVAAKLNMREMTEHEAAERLALLGYDRNEITEMLEMVQI
jgi:Holliday junction resolvasome RuvABC DNA-binding subunit